MRCKTKTSLMHVQSYRYILYLVHPFFQIGVAMRNGTETEGIESRIWWFQCWCCCLTKISSLKKFAERLLYIVRFFLDCLRKDSLETLRQV